MRGQVRTAFVDAGGTCTRYLVAGDGPPVVLLHGSSLAMDAQATWFMTIPALGAHFRVYAPDMIGFGGTQAAANGEHVARLARCEFVRAFLRALDIERCALVGHSEGGFVATKLALDDPALVSAVAIVASGGTAPRLGDARDAGWSKAATQVYDVLGGCTSEADFIRTIEPLSTTNPPEYIDLLRSNYRKARANGQYERLCRASLNGDYARYTELQERALFPRLSRLQARALLVWAGADPTVPVARGLKLMELMPAADMVVLASASHMVMIDRPDAFNRALVGWFNET